AVRAGAADPGLTDVPYRVAFVERVLERAELGIGLGRPRDLRVQQVRTFAAEAVKFEHEPADVSQLDLTQMPQVPNAAPDPAAREEARFGRNLRLGRWSRRLRRGGCLGCGGRLRRGGCLRRGGFLRGGRLRRRILRYPPAAGITFFKAAHD